MNSEIIDSYYSSLIFYLKDNFKHIFSKEKSNPEHWLISAWANKTSYSSVQLEIANDKSNLQSKKKLNNAINLKLTQTKSKKETLLSLKRQEIRIASLNDLSSDVNTTSNKS